MLSRRARVAHFADQAFELFLPLALRARHELFVRHRLRGQRRVDAFFQVALDLANPHGEAPRGIMRSILGSASRESGAALRLFADSSAFLANAHSNAE
jgi:hypothetical protein